MATNKPNRFWAGLNLLDRQIVDKNKRLAGNVDDVVFDVDAKGQLTLVALRSGPGALATRLGHRLLGEWLAHAHEIVDAHEGDIPIGKVRKMGPQIDVELEANELSSESTEQWFRDHVISHIPGSGHAPE
jgi:hypothetical protein